MLNELSQVVAALDRAGVSFGTPHPALVKMGKDSAIQISLDATGEVARVSFIPGELAKHLSRIRHSSEGSAFPGFNLPTPWRTFNESWSTDAKDAVTALADLIKKKSSNAQDILLSLQTVLPFTNLRQFDDRKAAQFEKSVRQLVGWLLQDLANAPEEFQSFVELLNRCAKRQWTLAAFTEAIPPLMFAASDLSRDNAVTIVEALIGSITFTKVKKPVASPDWLKAKHDADFPTEGGPRIPVYLNLIDSNHSGSHVRPQFWASMNQLLNERQPSAYKAQARKVSIDPAKATKRKPTNVIDDTNYHDAFTGNPCSIPDTFPTPKLAKLGNVRLFSNNSGEAKCLARYGLGSSETFPMDVDLAQRMAGALEYLGSEENLSKTCRAVPQARDGKKELILVYLDGEPPADNPLADLLAGSCADQDGRASFEAITQEVLPLLNARRTVNPSLRAKLFSIAEVDTANRQVSLTRDFEIADLMEATDRWNTAYAQIKDRIQLYDWDKTKKTMMKSRPPSVFPLDLVITANKIWSTDSKSGLASNFNRAITVSDAFDVFLRDTQRTNNATRQALSILVTRLRTLFLIGGEYKLKRDFKILGDGPRRELLKGVSLLAILIQLQEPNLPMQEPTYYLGRLLACADALHLEYCKRVRDGAAPTQLIGNALFNTALEQPTFALARLAERITPYQAWARTYKHTPKDENDRSGWEKSLLGYIAECCAQFIECETDNEQSTDSARKRIRTEALPERMTDIDKAKLMLGYLADLRDTKTSK